MMRKTLGPTLFAILLAAPVAQAATVLFSRPLPIGNNTLTCWVTNITTGPRAVRIEAFNDFGGLVHDSDEVDLDALATAPLDTAPDPSGQQPPARVCRFTVEGAKTSYRAGACVNQVNVGCVADTHAE